MWHWCVLLLHVQVLPASCEVLYLAVNGFNVDYFMVVLKIWIFIYCIIFAPIQKRFLYFLGNIAIFAFFLCWSWIFVFFLYFFDFFAILTLFYLIYQMIPVRIRLVIHLDPLSSWSHHLVLGARIVMPKQVRKLVIVGLLIRGQWPIRRYWPALAHPSIICALLFC